MAYPGPFPFKVQQGGTGEITLAPNAVLIGQNASDITVTNVGTNGQVMLGATGLPPAFATLTSTGGTVAFTLGANSLNLEAGGSVAITFAGDGGTATPSLNTITMAGGNNMSTVASGSTVTYSLAGTTDHAVQVGNASGSLSSLGVGSNGQVLLGATAANPAFATLTSTGGTIVFTTGANSLNLEASGTTAASFPTDSGTAVPALGALTVAGGNNIGTTGSGSTVTINLDGTTDHAVQIGNAGGSLTSVAVGATNTVLLGNTGADPSFGAVPNAALVNSSITLNNGNNITVTGSPVSLGGAASIAVSGTTNHAVQIGNASASLSSISVGTNGQVIVGATGADPAFATLTSTGGTIVFTTGANTLNLESSGSTAASFPTDSGTAVPSLGALTVAGGTNIGTTGAGSTVTINLDGTTNHAVQVGNAGGSITSLSVGTNGQVLLGATAADPAFITPTAGTGLSITTNATTLQYAVGSTVAITFAADSGTATPSANTITFAGGTNCTTSASGSTVTIDATGGTSFTWNEETTTSASMAVNNGYIANNAGLVTLTLPATAAVGDVVRVSGKGAGGWRIAQNAGQTIYFGTSTTTTGATGRLDSSQRRDGIELLCVTANNDWNVLSAQGNITVT